LNALTTNGSINLIFQQIASGCANLGVKQYTGIPVRLAQ
jgi:hypothetical protein